MKKIIILFVFLAVLIFAVSYAKNLSNLPSFPSAKTSKITIGKTTFKALVAKSDQDREVGLSKQSKLDQDMGMIFTFEKPDYYSFWMKDMKFPIDIVFINKDKIVTIFTDVQPPKKENEPLLIFNSSKPSDTVLEINAGLSEKNNFKEGDTVKIELQ